MRSRAYRGVEVNRVEVAALVRDRGGQGVQVGLDVGKREIWVMLRWGVRDFDRPWKVRNPDQVRLLAEHLKALGVGREMKVALEPTGTYGDALRQALAEAGVAVYRVSPKMACDYAECFDGVPSQHDAKDAAVVAELSSQGRSWLWAWPTRTAEDQEREYWVDQLDAQRRQALMWYGRLEASLSRHWPEAGRLLKLSSGVLLRVLSEYGGPRGLAADAEGLRRVRGWGRSLLSSAKAETLVSSAVTTAGVRMGPWDEKRLQSYAREVLGCRKEMQSCRKRIAALAKGNAILEAQAEVVGVATASVLWVHLGDPRQYHCGSAYVKAMGLNLTERSSGQHEGELRISKRGPATVRRWLYLAALRWVRREPVKSWYREQKASRRGVGKPAVVGVMRKLARTLYGVGGRGEKFDPSRLFDAVEKRSRPEPGIAARGPVLGAGAP